ncbi:tyrosine-type recombinase/integrase [Bacillus sp. FJAT-47783]|uniref:tyrosine-type recombinase/integrase n=1 Tax=Bacillus sp. FJAT-47783 TaxID=2922712 RepID=UPI001FAC35EC|nr:tyrosine-type recombinase/integrase [Bacillus sp. FJAT-47783]
MVHLDWFEGTMKRTFNIDVDDLLTPAEHLEKLSNLTERGIQKMLTKYAKLANMENVTSHRFRHRFCKNLVNATTPIRKFARHESIQTTAIYIDSSQEEQVEALRKM